MSRLVTLLIWWLVLLSAVPGARAARQYIEIVGSSTVYPFATVVAERFGRATPFRTPKIEATGSGGGIKLFCGGLGLAYPDIVNTSRPIKASELQQCRQHGVQDIVEVLIGYDGIVLGQDKQAQALQLTRRELYLALAARVPGQGGDLIDNPYRTWSEINPELPDYAIEVLGPPPTSGTRDAFVELVMAAGCRQFSRLAALEHSDPRRFAALCYRLREDGAFVDAGENDNLIVQKLQANSRALGILGFSFLEQNSDLIQGTAIDGHPPQFAAIARGDYPVSRPLYFYVKKAHVGVVPGLRAYLAEFTSAKAWGGEGYLAQKGMIPLPAELRAQVARRVTQLAPLAAAQAN